MAFGEKNIPILDFNNSKAIGIDLPLNGRGIFKPNYFTKDALKSGIINFLLTNPGERYMNPNFGAGIRDYIFTQLQSDNLDFLREDLETKIKRLFPNIEITQFNIFRNDNNNSISIKFLYDIINTNLTDEITISFE